MAGVPPPIRRLDASVVNRIAAGEVIQRPASSLKELVENSLDAGSTSVSVTAKDGGLKLLQVCDNGHGIRFEDLPILCERHTTSKITAYEDLGRIKTLGFRGEALASMTFVAHLKVTTMSEGQAHGYRAEYKDGLIDGDARPCAAVIGTTVTVENLFYNVTARRKAFKNPSEEYGRMISVLSKYAVHNVDVSFSCKKFGETRPDLYTAGGNTSRLDAIRSVYGASVSRELIEVSVSDDSNSGSFTMDGYISSANYSSKKTTMVLFINDRVVDCSPLKKAVEVVYATILPKASKPFIYMSIHLPPQNVDVNIHPTKQEVGFLNQESLIETIQKAVESELLRSNTTRTYFTQTTLPGASTVPAEEHTPSKQSTQKPPVNKLVRTDSQNPAGRIHAFFSEHSSSSELTTMRAAIKQRRNSKGEEPTSIQELLSVVDRKCHSGLLDIVKSCTFIGMADENLALIQHKTRLFLVNSFNLGKELLFQQVLKRFENFNTLRLTSPAPLYDLMLMALDEEEQYGRWHESDGSKQDIAKVCVDMLKGKAELLLECFSMEIDEHDNLCTLPLVLDQYIPDMDRLPYFILDLGNNVDWALEKSCFEEIAASLAQFYAPHPPVMPRPSEETAECFRIPGSTELDEELIAEAEAKWDQRDWTIQHVIFPAMRLFLKPARDLATNGTFVQVGCLENLYKIFERC